MIRLWLATALVLLPLDAGWLSLMAEPLYRAQLGPLLRPEFALAPAVAFYLLYVTGIVALAQRGTTSWREAGARGAVLGLVAYGTYDLTNQATLQGWPVVVTLADLAWGAVLTGTAAGVGKAASMFFFGKKNQKTFSP